MPALMGARVDVNDPICLREEAIFVRAHKSPCHVTFDIDLDLEHIFGARSPGDHRMQVWSQSSHLSRSRSDLRKNFTDGQRDGRTDGRTSSADVCATDRQRRRSLSLKPVKASSAARRCALSARRLN